MEDIVVFGLLRPPPFLDKTPFPSETSRNYCSLEVASLPFNILTLRGNLSPTSQEH